MGLILPNPGVPTNGQALDATPLLANQTAITQSIQSFDATQIQAGTLNSAASFGTAINPVTRTNESTSPFVSLGCTWSIVSGLQGTMAGGVIYVNGIRVPVVGVGSKVFTASQDTYVDIDVNGNVTYVSVANGATAGMTLTANALRVAKIVTSGSAITTITQSGYDPLYNRTYPQSPSQSALFNVQSFVNTGSAGGTFYFMNLGGVKMLWGQTGLIAATGAGALTLPLNLFSSIQSAMAAASNNSGVANVYGSIDAVSTTSVRVIATTTGGATNVTLSVWIMGT